MKTLLLAMGLALVTSAGIAEDEGTNTTSQTNDPVHQEYQQPQQEQQHLYNEQQPGQDEETRQKEDEKRQEQLLQELQKEGEDINK